MLTATAGQREHSRKWAIKERENNWNTKKATAGAVWRHAAFRRRIQKCARHGGNKTQQLPGREVLE